MRRSIVCLLVAALLLFASAYLPITQHAVVHYLRVETPLQPTCAIVVLGGGLEGNGQAGVSTRKRVAFGVYLHKIGLGRWLIVSGGDEQSGACEARVMRQLAMQSGISKQSIIAESASQNTYENAVCTAQILRDRQLGAEVILVTSPYHMRRACLCFAKQGVQVLPAPVPASEVYEYGFYQNLRNMRLLGHELAALVYYRFSQRI